MVSSPKSHNYKIIFKIMRKKRKRALTVWFYRRKGWRVSPQHPADTIIISCTCSGSTLWPELLVGILHTDEQTQR